MKPSIIVLLFLSLVIFRSVADLQDWHGGDFNLLQKSTKGPGSRSLLEHDKYDIQPNHDKAILSLRDGTLCLMAKDSPNALWCFSTGSSISNLYQDDRNDDSAKKKTSVLDEEMELDRDDIMVDLGRGYDVELSTEFGETNLLNSVAEYVRSTPHISKDGITLGEKRTTVFLLDANDGTLINAFNLGGFSPRLGVPSDGDHNALPKKLGESTPTDLQSVKLLYVTRNDYLLQHYAPISRKVLWNLTFSEIQAYFPHPQRKLQLPVIHVRDGALVRFLYEKFKIKDGNTMLLPSLSTAIVVAESVDQNALPQRVSGSTDQNSPSLVIASDIDRNSLSRKEKYIHFSYNDNVVLCLLALLVAVLCYMGIKSIRRKKSIKQLNDSNGNQTAAPKRKKPRKVGSSKSGANNKSIDKGISSEEADTANQFPNTERNGKEPWLDFGIPADDGSNGRIVGKLYISNTEIAKGSDGTIVFEGKYDGRPVAVKRLVKAHHKVAYKEIQHLIASDRHPNIVRWYGAEHDADFVYLSLERCTCSLNDLIQICSVSSQNVMKSVNGYTVQLDSVKGINMDVELWKANAYPSTQLLKLMRDIVSGLAHLHELGIIHRDLKPQNILIIKERSLCAKLSDMGISKRLLGDNASLGHHPTGLGSSGWQAPEQLLNGRQTRAVDLFSLGCVLFFCITGGKHPYGEYFERDQNIVKNQVDLFVVEHIPEAVDLLSHLLDSNPELRLTAVDVVHHPLFWSSEMRLSFLRDASDRVELEDRENDSDILKALESAAPVALGGNWDQKMEAAFLNNIGRYRRYKFDSSRDLLRVMRNKLNHYRELPKEIQEILGAVPDGFDEYFTSRFPKFLVEVYKVVQKYCREEEWFQKYFRSSLV